MGIGARVRQMCGPLEPLVTDLYRAAFISLPAFARKLQQLCLPKRVLEVGCGEGALVTQMARLWPSAQFDAIDLTPRLGRLYQGERSRVRFRQISVQEFATAEPKSMDLVVFCDVLHHIPYEQRGEVLRAAARSLRPEGLLVIKEWVRNGNPVYWLGYFADRYITGERIRYGTRDEWLRAFEEALAPLSLHGEFSVAPWSCNRGFLFKLGAAS